MKRQLTTLLAAFILMSGISLAKGFTDIEDIRANLPKMLGASSAGTEFVMTFHPCWQTSGENNAMKIYVSSGEATAVTLEIEALGIKQTQVTIPNDVIEFSLEPPQALPYEKSDREPPLDDQVFLGRGIVLTAEAPIIAYGVVRYQATSDGFLALPISSLGNDYIVASWEDVVWNTGPGRIQWLTSYTSIVAAYDETRVRFTMGGNYTSQTPTGLKPGDSRVEIMQKGDVWLVGVIGPYSDVTGSKVESNKPVAVISGSFCAYVPRDVPACDYMIEQDLPIFTWGTDYHMSPIKDRTKNSWMRIFPKEPYTKIYRDGNQIATIQTPGGIENYGWINRRADGAQAPNRPLTFSGDKAISVMQINNGMNDQTPTVDTDPFMMVLTPIQQYQDEIVFNTPGIRGGVGFSSNYVNIVYKATVDGAIPDDLEFGRVVDGAISWMPLAGFDSNPGETFANSAGADGRSYKSKSITIPVDGVYKLKANDKFAAYAYGYDWYDSYGFPTSVALADLETPDTVAPQPNWTMDCYGNVPEDPTKPNDAYVEDWGTDPRFPPNDPERTSNLSLIVFDQAESYNYDFEYDDFVAGVDRTTNWSLRVKDIKSDARAIISFADRAGNDTTIEIRYYTTNLAVRHSYHNFGDMKVGDPPKTEEFTITNRSKEYPAVIENVFFKNAEPSFTMDISGLNKDVPLAPEETRTFEVTYTPLSDQSVSDSIIVEAWGMADHCLFRFGSEIEASAGTPRIYATNHNFMEYTVGKTTPYTEMQVINRSQDGGTNPLQITGVQFSNNIGEPGSGEIYEVDGLQGINEDNPITLQVDQPYTFRVRFTPDAVATYDARIDFISDAKDNEPKPYSLITGVGIQPSLLANSGNWDEKRVLLERYPVAHPDYDWEFPYASSDAAINPFGTTVIELINDGSQEVTLANPVIVENENGSAFKAMINGDLRPLNNQQVLNQLFQNKKIAMDGNMVVEVFFQPEESDNGAGNHRLVIEFPSDAPENPQTVLEGTGLYPIASTIDYDFGQTIVGAEPVLVEVSFRNTNWEWEDILTIYDLEVVNAGTINEDLGGYGTEFFTYDKTAIDFPVMLAPGDELRFTAYFQPQESRDFTAQIRTISDGLAEVTSTWTGSAVIQSVTSEGDNTVICKGEEPVLVSTYTNTGTDELSVSVSLTTDVAGNNPYTGTDFSILNADDFDIVAGATRQIQVEFAPDWPNEIATAGSPSVYVRYESSAYADNVTTSPIGVAWEGYPRVSEGKVNGNDDVSLKLGSINDSKFTYTLSITSGGLAMNNARNQMNINTINASIEYDTKFMSAVGIDEDLGVLSENVLSDMLYNKGYRVTEIVRYLLDGTEAGEYKREKIDLEISGGALLTENSEIPVLSAEFALLLPNMLGNEEGQYIIEGNESMIYHTLSTDNEPCVVIEEGSMPTVIREEVCVDNLRKIVVGPDFSLGSIEPNPVGPQGGTIEFGVGIETMTTIKIFNLAGELMSQPINERLRPGKYTMSIPVEDLPSGVYFYEMHSGPYKEVKKMIIQK